MNSIDGYFETPWAELNIEMIVQQLNEFDMRYFFLRQLFVFGINNENNNVAENYTWSQTREFPIL